MKTLPTSLRADLISGFLLLTSFWMTGCASPATEHLEFAGVWRAVLASPGGELPFLLEIERDDQGGLQAVVVNDNERVPTSRVVTGDGGRLTLHFDWYDSEIEATADTSGTRLEGRWRKSVPEGNSILPFLAERATPPTERFRPAAQTTASTRAADEASTDDVESTPIAGTWHVQFSDDSGTEPARGEFEQDGTVVTGTFLTPTGDYRFLEGDYRGGLLRLSTFDGAHAFLFQARRQANGSLQGDFWSRDSYHATWTAQRLEPPNGDDKNNAAASANLPDAWQLVGLRNDEGRFDFTFPDLDDQPVSLSDPRFDGKVVLVNIFGSWCPNCNDEAPLLAAWHKRYQDRGFEIVGLAYELRGDPKRDREMVRRFADRYDLDYPLLLAGTSDKQAAAETLPDLTAVVAFPTTIFVGRDGRVRRIHSGFSGPGTGEHYTRLLTELEGTLEALLDEPPSDGGAVTAAATRTGGAV